MWEKVLPIIQRVTMTIFAWAALAYSGISAFNIYYVIKDEKASKKLK